MNSYKKVMSSAFIHCEEHDTITKQHAIKLNQFINLVELSELSVTMNNQLPLYSSMSDYDIFCVDCYNLDSEDALPDEVMQLALNANIILFNCTHNAFCEKLALLAGIQGIFYKEDKADIVIKGLENIKKYERWFKRAVMNQALSDLLKNQPDNPQSKSMSNQHEQVENNLTRREQTIASMISSGAQNKEIAEQLHISPNTVKTHLYSIFRKTRSRNRIELLAWSQQYFAS
ncbi:response regulator transcription factor [Thalassotalea fusca]